jgi:PKD repeat protein
MRHFLLLFLLSFFNIYSFSQSNQDLKHCGTDQMHQLFYNRFLTRNDHGPKQSNDSDSILIIPVVFHVIHNYGNENIEDAQLENAIDVLNTDYRNMDTDTADIKEEFRYLIADCKIEFRLAQLDPYGNCTKGINRFADTLTYIGDHSVKSIIQWPPEKYLNIWVVDNAYGLAGHATLPSLADTMPSWDGIVIQHDYLGSIGTSSEFKSLVLTHEVGHYLNLQHTWGGNNAPDLPYWGPGDTANCNYDDGVDDTPNTIGWQTCNTAGTSCGSLDNVQNYMEYAYCTARMFTQGQKERMRACLTSSVANRNNLWSGQNLASTGISLSAILCTADFEADRKVICAGDSISFTDLSYHGVSSREWTFAGGNPSAGSDSAITVFYDTPGRYDVKLKVGNGTQQRDTVKYSYIKVLSSSGYIPPYWESFDTLTLGLDHEWEIINTDHEMGWELSNQASYSGSYSVMIQNHSNFFEGRIDELISNSIDLSGLNDVVLSFRYAYAKKTDSNNETLKIYVSKDCGTNWSLRASLSGSALATTGNTDSSFFPSSVNEWSYEEITNISSSYLVSDFQIKFEFESDGGNNIFIDDIYANDVPMNVGEAPSYSVYNIIPNPAKDELQLIFFDEQEYRIELLDMHGKIIFYADQINKKTMNIPIDFLSQGIYIIHLISSKVNYFDSFIKQ